MSESDLQIKRVGTFTTPTAQPSDCTVCGDADYGDVLINGVCGKCLLAEIEDLVHDRETLRAENERLTADLTAERERNRWIPVGDEDMPVVNDVVHISEPVLIRHTSGHILMATYDGDKWSTFPISDYFIDPSSVTHWRPIVPPEVE